MAADPQKEIVLSWEENVMRVRNQAKLTVSHFEEQLFSGLDQFFKLTNQVNKQIEIITKENHRLIKILEKNKIDYAPEPPKSPPTKDQTPAKTIEEVTIPPGAELAVSPPPPNTKGILPKKD